MKRFWKLWPAAVLLLAFYLWPVPAFDGDYSAVVLDSQGQMLRVYLNDSEQWCLPPGSGVPARLKTAVLHFEDRRFHYHPGVDPLAVARALRDNRRAGRVVSGASTITMQVVRLMDPGARTYSHKLQEAFEALKLELHHSKEEILELYLNHAPYGGNVVGYQAACWRYFMKPPADLSWSEAALLAVLPNAPSRISPTLNSASLKAKRDFLLDELAAASIIDAESCRLAKLEPVPRRNNSFPMIAPHAADLVRQDGAYVQTTIDSGLQREVQELVKTHSLFLQSQSIHNALALVVETDSGRVRAYVGSQDFWQSQVDGIQAMRSPGSTLKPLLYAAAMDEGLILPESMLVDIPTFYGAFAPQNADKSFSGLVPASDALIRSLNVPAVRLLDDYGVYPFYTLLREAGCRTLFRSADDYGLSLILGGCEVRPWDMAGLYRGLGRGGLFEPISIIESVQHESSNLISPAASWLTLNTIRQLKRPGAEYYWQQYQNQWPLAWKTGTSYGGKDAWAVGVSPDWTIVVWAGNFSGQGNPELSGAASAGPLLFDIFNMLPKKNGWFEKPDFEMQNICLDSGYAASDICPRISLMEVPPFAKQLRRCPYHKAIYVTADERFRVSSLCWEGVEHKRVSRLVYPPQVAQYLRQRGQSVGILPPFMPGCAEAESGLEIIYPGQGAKLWLPRDIGGRLQKISLRAASDQLNTTLYWYLDNVYLGSTSSRHEMPVQPEHGWHQLMVIDGSGQQQNVRFFVGQS